MPLPSRRLFAFTLLAVATGAGAAVLVYAYHSRTGGPTPPRSPPPASAEEVREFCGACHAYPPPETLPREAWRKEVLQGFRFAGEAGRMPRGLSVDGFVRYYEEQAPEELPSLSVPPLSAAPTVRFDRTALAAPGRRAVLSHLNLVALLGRQVGEVLACDMHGGRVLWTDPTARPPVWKVLAEVPHPAHAEVVDLDGDGIKDVVVANLGVFLPSDDTRGSVVWLRGERDGSFRPIPLLEGVGRVADVQAADFDRDGKLDLVVAVFGWRRTGEVVLLRNRTTDRSRPSFEPRTLDERHGAVQVPVADLDGDGWLDFVALFAQEHEQVVAFLNDRKGGFTPHLIYAAAHPTFGSCSIQLVDVNGDGRLDVLMANGDVLDPPYLLKPYHGLRWLENRGAYPFEPHEIGPQYGVMRAVADDFDGDGLIDVAAVSYLPVTEFRDRQQRRLPAVVLYHQARPGQFRAEVLEAGTCDHLTCVAGRLPGDASPSLLVGNGCFLEPDQDRDAFTLWRNRGRPGAK